MDAGTVSSDAPTTKHYRPMIDPLKPLLVTVLGLAIVALVELSAGGATAAHASRALLMMAVIATLITISDIGRLGKGRVSVLPAGRRGVEVDRMPILRRVLVCFAICSLVVLGASALGSAGELSGFMLAMAGALFGIAIADVITMLRAGRWEHRNGMLLLVDPVNSDRWGRDRLVAVPPQG